MPWDERQRAMLRELGVPAWLPAAAATPTPHAADPVRPEPAMPAVTAPSPVSVERPVSAPPAPSAPAADAARWAALGWDELRAAVAACEACSLCQTRRQTIFGIGHANAHWMVVGEAPGEQEDQRGEPFVGAAGQLLDRMLAALGVTRQVEAADGQPALVPVQQAYIANTLKCRPPRNRNPEPAEMTECEPFLVRQVELLQPRVILAMGRFAVQALLRSDEAIGRLRGRVHRYQGVPLVVTYHPAYLLRNPIDKAKAWEDLCLAAHVLESTPTR